MLIPRCKTKSSNCTSQHFVFNWEMRGCSQTFFIVSSDKNTFIFLPCAFFHVLMTNPHCILNVMCFKAYSQTQLKYMIWHFSVLINVPLGSVQRHQQNKGAQIRGLHYESTQQLWCEMHSTLDNDYHNHSPAGLASTQDNPPLSNILAITTLWWTLW